MTDATQRIERQRRYEDLTGASLVAVVLLTVIAPVVWSVASLGLAMASDVCSGEPGQTGICDPRMQELAVRIPLLGMSGAAVAAWLLLFALPRRSWRAWAVAGCWALALASLVTGYQIASMTPAG
jgi:hypothetical protein